jgi:outer membrane protein
MKSQVIEPSRSSSRSVFLSDSGSPVFQSKTFLLVRSILALAFFMASASAVAADTLRIGYVNAVRVIEEAPQGEAAKKKLEAEFGPRDKKLVAMQAQIKEIEDDLEKNGLLMKEVDRRAKEHELVVLKRDQRRAAQEFREDYNIRRNEELAAIQKVVQKAIIEIAQQENYDLVLHEGTIYASKRVDLTDKVLRRLGKK